MGPLLARKGRASIPNPGGCRIGARPIDRQIDAFLAMGADVSYSSDDGYFHGVCDGLSGTEITFTKNTHTGTEAVILAAVLARGKTVIRNAAAEIEIDDLIGLLNQMGADIVRTSDREVEIHGVSSLHGTEYQIMSDRNEEVTFAIAAAITGGEITVTGSQYRFMDSFLEPFSQAGGTYTVVGDGTVSYGGREPFRASDVMTRPYPGFMTDWQAPWALFMTQAKGVSTIHETIFESRFSYVAELKKMGARISFYDPPVDDPDSFYNFNWNDKVDGYHQAIRIEGPSTLHNAILEVHDLRAGATVLVAALTAEGESYITGVEQIDRGYEAIDTRLRALGAVINRHGGGNV
jgi:UDP-N-acetylglucosamine 1-carboxyvinyltransferase